MRKTSRVKNGIASFFKYFFMIFLIFISLAPIIWAFLGSFKSYAEINSSALSLPSSFNLDNYKAALQYAPILKYFMNSVLIVGISVLVTVALVAMCAYVISRFDFKLKTLIVLLISASLMLPAQAISQPLFAIFQKLGIFDTKLGLIIVYSAMGIPMSFFVMVSYYKTISTALEESAYIDGALMLTSGDRASTVPIALNYYMGTFAINYSALFAAVVMTVLPTIILFILLQRQVMESLTAGAVKG